MATIFKVERCDYYVVTVEAASKADALAKCETNDKYLNGGSFSGSVFEVIDEVQK